MVDIIKKYMQGHCDALAVALSIHLEMPIVTLNPTHIKKDGSKFIDPDFIHVVVKMSDNEFLDIKGIRSLDDVKQDFVSIMDLIKRDDDKKVEFSITEYATANDFVEENSTDISLSQEAILEAKDILQEHVNFEMLSSTLNEIDNLMMYNDLVNDF